MTTTKITADDLKVMVTMVVVERYSITDVCDAAGCDIHELHRRLPYLDWSLNEIRAHHREVGRLPGEFAVLPRRACMCCRKPIPTRVRGEDEADRRICTDCTRRHGQGVADAA